MIPSNNWYHLTIEVVNCQITATGQPSAGGAQISVTYNETGCTFTNGAIGTRTFSTTASPGATSPPPRNLSRWLRPAGVSQAADVSSSAGWLIQAVSGMASIFGMTVGVVNRVGCCARAAVRVSIRRVWVVSAWP